MEADSSAGPAIPQQPHRRRPLWPVPACAAVIVLVLAIALAILKTQDDRPRARVGAVLNYPFQEDPLPHRGEVLLPWAKVQVGAGKPRSELPDLLDAPANLQAPEDGSFVRVDAALDEGYAIPLAAVAAPFTGQTEIVLRADGRDYPLSGPGGLVLDPNGPHGQGGSRWVAVEGTPSDLEVRVTVDGLTQIVDASDGSVDAGRAAELAAIPSAEELQGAQGAGCGEARRVDHTPLRIDYPKKLTCTVQLSLRTPYVDGLGWAEPGHEFLLVHIIRPRHLSLETGNGAATRYWDSVSRTVVRLDGERGLGGIADVNSLNQGGIQDVDNPEQVVFDVSQTEPVGELTIRLDVQARLGEPFVTDRQRVRVQWAVPGRKLA